VKRSKHRRPKLAAPKVLPHLSLIAGLRVASTGPLLKHRRRRVYRLLLGRVAAIRRQPVRSEVLAVVDAIMARTRANAEADLPLDAGCDPDATLLRLGGARREPGVGEYPRAGRLAF
jgi:hypothetical protein